MAPPMDELGWILAGVFVLGLAFLLALGRWYPGSGAEQVDWRPTRSIEQEIELELDDVEQMLEANNARRRASGREEISEEDVRADVAEHERRMRERPRPPDAA